MEPQLREQLVKHLDEAYAMEQQVLRLLSGMIETTHDAELEEELRHHREETEEQVLRLKERLDAYEAKPSAVKELGGVMTALVKGVLDMARSEKAGRNARDGYATEHMEIAAYELLERVAAHAGDEATAEVARANRAEEEEMARKIAARWDEIALLSLEEAGARY